MVTFGFSKQWPPYFLERHLGEPPARPEPFPEA